jgi:hypothetical protein
VVREYTITYSRSNTNNAVNGRAYLSAEADAERLSVLVTALTDKKPGVYWKSDGEIDLRFTMGHLEGFMRYKELADAIEEWLEETSR